MMYRYYMCVCLKMYYGCVEMCYACAKDIVLHGGTSEPGDLVGADDDEYGMSVGWDIIIYIGE